LRALVVAMSAPWGFGICTASDRRTRVAWFSQCERLGIPYIAVWQRRGATVAHVKYDCEPCAHRVVIRLTVAGKARLSAFFLAHARGSDVACYGEQHGTLRVHAPLAALTALLLEVIATATWLVPRRCPTCEDEWWFPVRDPDWGRCARCGVVRIVNETAPAPARPPGADDGAQP
jgi:hypothetical protein